MLERFLTATPAQARMLVFQETDETLLKALLDTERRAQVREAVSSRLEAMYAGKIQGEDLDTPEAPEDVPGEPHGLSGPTIVPPPTVGPTLVPLEERTETPKPKEGADDLGEVPSAPGTPSNPLPIEEVFPIFPKKVRRKKSSRSDPDVVMSSTKSSTAFVGELGSALPPPGDIEFETSSTGPDDSVESAPLESEFQWSCRKCHFVGVPDDFGWRNVGGKRYRQPYCRPCRRDASRKSRMRKLSG